MPNPVSFWQPDKVLAVTLSAAPQITFSFIKRSPELGERAELTKLSDRRRCARYSLLPSTHFKIRFCCSVQHLTAINGTRRHSLCANGSHPKIHDGSIRPLESHVISMTTQCSSQMYSSGRELCFYHIFAILV